MLTLRLADAIDCDQVFDWRNTDWVVRLGAQNRPVTWEEHVQWWCHVTTDPDHILWMVEPDAGTVRLDRENGTATISIYLMPEWCGKGEGTRLIREAARRAFRHWPIQRVVASIVAGNTRSEKAFSRAGFRLVKTEHDTFATLERPHAA